MLKNAIGIDQWRSSFYVEIILRGSIVVDQWQQ